MDTFAKNLRKRAEILGMSNAEVAELCGLDTRRYGHYVTGRNEPDLATLLRIAQILKTTPNQLLGVDEGEAPPQVTALVTACKYLNETQIQMLVDFAEAALRRK